MKDTDVVVLGDLFIDRFDTTCQATKSLNGDQRLIVRWDRVGAHETAFDGNRSVLMQPEGNRQ